jgi:hypothetical protein
VVSSLPMEKRETYVPRFSGFLKIRSNSLEPTDVEVGAALKASLVGLEVS